jgi:hypothetical protein
VDTPILPDRRGDEGDAPLRPRYLPPPEFIRGLAATVGLLAAVLGLASQLEQSDTPAAPASPPAAVQAVSRQPMVQFGDPVSPHALVRGKTSDDPAREVCTDESRPHPRSGHWRCNVVAQLQARDRGRIATPQAGACTHRVVDDGSKAWRCVARVAVPELVRRPYRGGSPFFGGPLEGNDVCVSQARSDPRRGAWHCTVWRLFPAGWDLLRPVEPPGSCSFRVADQLSGSWSCRSTLPA